MSAVRLLLGEQFGGVRRPSGRDPLRGLLTITAAARLRGVNPSNVRRAVRLGILPAWRLPGAVRETDLYLIPLPDLERWQPRCSDRRTREGRWHRTRDRVAMLEAPEPADAATDDPAAARTAPAVARYPGGISAF